MPALLLFQPLPPGLHQRLKSIQTQHGGALLLGQMSGQVCGQPIGRDVEGGRNLVRCHRLQPLKAFRNGAVEAVEKPFILDESEPDEALKPGRVIELLPNLWTVLRVT